MLKEEFSKSHDESKRILNLLEKIPYQETYTEHVEWSLSDDNTTLTGRFGDPLEASRYLYTVLIQAVHGTTANEKKAFLENNEEFFKVKTYNEEEGIHANLQFPADLLSSTNLVNMTRIIYGNGLDAMSIERSMKKLNIDLSQSRPL